MMDRPADSWVMRLIGFLILALAASLLSNAAASASSFKVIYSFCEAHHLCPDGGLPSSKILADSAGDLFGTTWLGGKYNGGTVYELIPSGNGRQWGHKTIYNFCAEDGCADGSGPYGDLIIDSAGNLYGGTTSGGTGSGVIFKVSPSGTYTILYTLCPGGGQCNDGHQAAHLTYAGAADGSAYDGASPLYGLVSGGAADYGNAFSLKNNADGSWGFSVLHSFCSAHRCSDGGNPSALTMDGGGDLLGVTELGGKYRHGLVFKLAPDGNGQWNEASLYDFCPADRCLDGAYPFSLSISADGTLHGTAVRFGPNCQATKHMKDCGALFQLNPDGAGYNLLYGFCAQTNCEDGAVPLDMEEVQPNNFFGSTAYGGQKDAGTLFEFHNGSFRSLYKFCKRESTKKNCAHGKGPGPLTAGRAGSLFGWAGDGAFGGGEVFEFLP